MLRLLTLVSLILLLSASGFARDADSDRHGDSGRHSDPDRHWEGLVAAAREAHGELGARAARFLAEHRPPRDALLDPTVFAENLEVALRAREELPWARALSEERFFNDVLPYAVLDETRESWRPRLWEIGREIVADCETASEAAQALNAKLFDAVEVHYNTGRKKPNQSPAESIAQGRASCTGLSILLVDACRAMGVPARVAGVASWNGKNGNHTWVEIWDGTWHFTGADEYDANGLDRAWFVGDAARAIPGDPLHAVWASSWKKDGAHFPMVWNEDDESVGGVDVTHRYLRERVGKENLAIRHLRVRTTAGGERIVAEVEVIDPDGETVTTVSTRAGRADLNDMPTIELVPGVRYRAILRHGEEQRVLPVHAKGAGEETLDLEWDSLPLGRRDAEQLLDRLWAERADALRRELEQELDAQTIRAAGQELQIREKVFGDEPEGGHSLWISMHGGGGAPKHVNDQQWRNQIRLYRLEGGIYVAPRAPTDTWNLWHQEHIDPLFDRLIAAYVIARGVNPDRVYLLGYSAGGDGVFQLAPRMADRYAAAAMMAGHPNETSPLGLRNLPYALFMGGKDSAYGRNRVARQWKDQLAELHEADPTGYRHLVRIYAELGHWMNGRDAEALPWMAKHTRNPWPRTVVWHQDDVTHTRFYWLEVTEPKPRTTLTARVEGQTVFLESDDVHRVTLRLSDHLLDLDREVSVQIGEQEVFHGLVPRTEVALRTSLEQRADPRSAATATLSVNW